MSHHSRLWRSRDFCSRLKNYRPWRCPWVCCNESNWVNSFFSYYFICWLFRQWPVKVAGFWDTGKGLNDGRHFFSFHTHNNSLTFWLNSLFLAFQWPVKVTGSFWLLSDDIRFLIFSWYFRFKVKDVIELYLTEFFKFFHFSVGCLWRSLTFIGERIQMLTGASDQWFLVFISSEQ